MEHDGSDGERPKSLNLWTNRRSNEWLRGNCHPFQRRSVTALTEGVDTGYTKGAGPPDANRPDPAMGTRKGPDPKARPLSAISR
jgi:hypothetical protein